MQTNHYLDFIPFSDMKTKAIKAYFPYSDIQKCTVPLSRNIYKHMKKENANYLNKKIKEIKNYCDTYDKGIYIFENEIVNHFKDKYLNYIEYLNSKKEEFLAFLKYPEAIRKLINTTNAVESFHSTFEKL